MKSPIQISVLVLATALLAPVMTGCGASNAQGAGAAGAACGAAAGDDGLASLTDEQLARKLLAVTGAADIGKQVADTMIDSFRKMPNMPPGFADRFKANVHTDELTQLVVPIYLKHYDRQTMTAAIRFYQSDAGRALVKEMPAAAAESMEVGKKWGMELAAKTLKDMGIDPTK